MPTTGPKRQVKIATEEGRVVNGVVHRPDGLKYLTPVRAQAFLGLVRAGNSLSQELSSELEAEHGISLRAFEVLLFLAVFSDQRSLSMTQLSEEAPLSQSRVSRLVADLETMGLVERSPSESDGRGVNVTITHKGIQKFRAAQDTHLAGLERRLFTPLTSTEIRQLAAIATKILEATALS
jgi:DNA-binding MarR family transcriptional regulator